MRYYLDMCVADPTQGFPLDFFPVLFAVPRVVGWLAHWRQVQLLIEFDPSVID